MSSQLIELCAVHDDDIIDVFRKIKIDTTSARSLASNFILPIPNGGGCELSSSLIYWRIFGSNLELVERSSVYDLNEALQIELVPSFKPVDSIGLIELEDILHVIIPCRSFVFISQLRKDTRNMYLTSFQPASFVRRVSVQWNKAIDTSIGMVENDVIAVLARFNDSIEVLLSKNNETVVNSIVGQFECSSIVNGQNIIFVVRNEKIECRNFEGEILHSYSIPIETPIAHWSICALKHKSAHSLRLNVSISFQSSQSDDIHIQTLEFTKSSKKWRAFSLNRRKFDLKSKQYIVKSLTCISLVPSELIILLIDKENEGVARVLHAINDTISEADLRQDFPDVDHVDVDCLSLSCLRKAAALAERKPLNSLQNTPLCRLNLNEQAMKPAVKFQIDEWTPLAIFPLSKKLNAFILVRRGSMSLLLRMTSKSNDMIQSTYGGAPFQMCKLSIPPTIFESVYDVMISGDDYANCSETIRKFSSRIAVFLLGVKVPNQLGRLLARTLFSRISPSEDSHSSSRMDILSRFVDNEVVKLLPNYSSDHILLCDILPLYFHTYHPCELIQALLSDEPHIIEFIILYCLNSAASNILRLIRHHPDMLTSSYEGQAAISWKHTSISFLQCVDKLVYEENINDAIHFLYSSTETGYLAKILKLVQNIHCLENIKSSPEIARFIIHCVELLTDEYQRQVDFHIVRKLFLQNWQRHAELVHAIKCPLLKQNLTILLVCDLCKYYVQLSNDKCSKDLVRIFRMETIRAIPNIVESFINQYTEVFNELPWPSLSTDNLCEELASIELDHNRKLNALRIYLSHVVALSELNCSKTDINNKREEYSPTKQQHQLHIVETQCRLLDKAISLWTSSSLIQLRRNTQLFLRVNANSSKFEDDCSELSIVIVKKLISRGFVMEAIDLSKSLNREDVVQSLVEEFLKLILSNNYIVDQEDYASENECSLNDNFSSLENLVKNVFSSFSLAVFLLSTYLRIQVNSMMPSATSVSVPDWIIDFALDEDAAATLRLYLSYGLVCDACEIAVHFINQCTDSLNPISNKNVFFPVGSLDQLLASLRFQLATLTEDHADPVVTNLLNILIQTLIRYATKIEHISNSWHYEMQKKLLQSKCD
ncbi:hypothetical protein GJ496_005869 [Pomphorhynchus laevis]|nr:hypothetical protein GJ496_005869 [Pomphorhynchus laevis]